MKTWSKWEKSLLVFGIILVLAAAGVVYGVITHEEPIFTNQSKSWNHTPLVVVGVDPSPGGLRSHNQEDLETAVRNVNQRLGFQMLRLAGVQEPERDIVVEFEAAYDADTWDAPGGHYQLRSQGATYTACEVALALVHGEVQLLSLEHELGHCMGLAHDPQTNGVSIMVPTLTETPDGQIPRWITDDDKKALRSKYNGSH